MKIRHQQVAGYFYPAEKDKLAKRYFLTASSCKTGKII